jgi:hypothetical protein
MGPKGERGEAGEPGAKGDKGDAGERGEKGEKGEKGDSGLDGRDGAVGARGERGEQGERGERGEKGDKGDKGEQGESGLLHANYPLQYDANKKSLSIDLSKVKGIAGGSVSRDGGGGGMDTAFKTISVAGQSDLNSVQYDAETLTFVAGANVSITTDPSTNSLTISSSGGGSGGNGVIGGTGATGAQGIQGVTGATGPQGISGAISFTSSTTAPTGATYGDMWFNTSSGNVFVYITDGSSSYWVEPFGPQGATGATGATGSQGITGFFGLRYQYSTGATGATGYITGNYDVNTPVAGSNNLYISATDFESISREKYWDYGRDNQNTGRTEVGQLYVTSYDRNTVFAYTIGSVTKTGTGATAFYTFNWSSNSSTTGGTFLNGERFGVYYIPGGRLGAAGSKGDAGTNISATNVTITTAVTDEGVTRTANLVSTLSDGSSVSANLNLLGVRTFTQTTTPFGGMYNGDRWVNTDNGKLYLYTVLTGSTAANQGVWVQY